MLPGSRTRASRVPSEGAVHLCIVGVSKRQPAAAVIEAFGSGLSHFGENYLQEALDKIAAVANPAIEWHFRHVR